MGTIVLVWRGMNRVRTQVIGSGDFKGVYTLDEGAMAALSMGADVPIEALLKLEADLREVAGALDGEDGVDPVITDWVKAGTARVAKEIANLIAEGAENVEIRATARDQYDSDVLRVSHEGKIVRTSIGAWVPAMVLLPYYPA
jgi:hypothetical protein